MLRISDLFLIHLILVDAENELEYDRGMQGGYNRESGRKTLLFVGILITLVVVFSILSLMMLGKSNT